MIPRHGLAVLACAALPCAATAEDYLGGLRLPTFSQAKSGLTAPAGTFSLESESFTPFVAFGAARAADTGFRFKLGYKYSRYLSVESEFVDLARAPANVFASPGSLASAFRSTGFGVDTVATLPTWRSLSLYGRLGAYHGETRNAFAMYSTSLLGDGAARSTRVRYGLGMRYDFSKAFGIHAELERYSPLGSPVAGEPDSEVSVGVAWRF